MISSRLSRVVAPVLAAAVCVGAGAGSAEAVNYGPISHKGLKKAGGASTSSKLALQIGLVANNSGIQSAAKKASNPKSDSYGKYPRSRPCRANGAPRPLCGTESRTPSSPRG